MKTKLMLAALLAFASMAQAGPPMTPAKIKRPLHLSQVTSIFPRSEPVAPVPQASAPVHQAGSSDQKASASVQQVSAAEATSTAAPITAPVSKKVHLNTFLNHPKTAPGPK